MKSIRDLRQDRGWTQYELALKVGVQAQAVYFWESGKRTPKVVQMRKLGEVFGICSDSIALDSITDPIDASPRTATDTIEDNARISPDPDDNSIAS
jgi:DNA-binding XRE family transcriptional regulator